MNKAKKRIEQALNQRGFVKLAPNLWAFMPGPPRDRPITQLDVVLAGGLLARYTYTDWVVSCGDKSQVVRSPEGLRTVIDMFYTWPRELLGGEPDA